MATMIPYFQPPYIDCHNLKKRSILFLLLLPFASPSRNHPPIEASGNKTKSYVNMYGRFEHLRHGKLPLNNTYGNTTQGLHMIYRRGVEWVASQAQSDTHTLSFLMASGLTEPGGSFPFLFIKQSLLGLLLLLPHAIV